MPGCPIRRGRSSCLEEAAGTGHHDHLLRVGARDGPVGAICSHLPLAAIWQNFSAASMPALTGGPDRKSVV